MFQFHANMKFYKKIITFSRKISLLFLLKPLKTKNFTSTIIISVKYLVIMG